MKTNKTVKNVWMLVALTGLFAFNSCSTEENAPMNIEKVFLENAANSSKTDRDLSLYGNFVRKGQTVRLQGSGFTGINQILVNGKACAFNPVLVTDNNIVFNISSTVPVQDVPEDVKNTICLVKGSQRCCYDIEIRAAAPTITGVSHTMPQAGEEITLTGTGLQEITDVVFPGNVAATSFSSDDVDGKWVTVTVPAGITENGSILVLSDNGGAYSPANFNYKAGLLENFDDVKTYDYGLETSVLTAGVPATSSNLPKSQGAYQVFNVNGSLTANNVQKCWLNSAAVQSIMASAVPASTSTDNCGIQMDIYVEGEWNSGIIRYVVADGWGNDRYCMLYQPVYDGHELAKKDGNIIYTKGTYNKDKFKNPDCWFTITLPFSSTPDFDGKTLADVLAQMASAAYNQSGPFFENSGIPDVFDAVIATQKIYFDNIRIVPLTTPEYSDFPDED